MQPVDKTDSALADAPRAWEDTNLNELIDLALRNDSPVVITDGHNDIGVVTNAMLLRGVRGEAHVH
jgi:hypothetical protein